MYKLYQAWGMISLFIIIVFLVYLWNMSMSHKGELELCRMSDSTLFNRMDSRYTKSIDSLVLINNELREIDLLHQAKINELIVSKKSVSEKYKPKYEYIKNANSNLLLNEFKLIFAGDTLN